MEKTSSRTRFNLLLSNSRLPIRLAWKASPRWFSASVGFAIMASLLPALQVWLSRELINALISASQTKVMSQHLILFTILSLILLLLQAAASFGKDYSTRRFEDELKLKVTLDIMHHAAILEAELFDDASFQDTLERAKNNIATRLTHFVNSGLQLFSTILETLALIGLLLILQPLVLILMLLVMLPYLHFYWRNAEASYQLEYHRIKKRRWMNYFTRLLLSRDSVIEIKLLQLAPLLMERYEGIMREMMSSDHNLYLRKFFGTFVFGLIFAFVNAGLLYWLILGVVTGGISVGDITVYIGSLARLRSNLENSAQSFTSLLEDVLYTHDLAQFLQIQPLKSAGKNHEMPEMRGAIRFENVSFHYPQANQEVLHEINLDIKAGEMIGIVGENGAGKSTLVKLLAGLYSPTEGRIYLDNHNLQDLSTEFLFRHIAFVLQFFNRYEASVQENIAYGDWQRLLHQPESVQAVARAANIEEMIEEFPKGYETILGRMFGELDLSGGQWQKLAIARAFARDARLLILDEPSSQLDPLSEFKMIQQFRQLQHGRTALVISHRFSTVIKADRIIVMDKGRIIEQGNHEVLMALDGHYARLFRLQELNTSA